MRTAIGCAMVAVAVSLAGCASDAEQRREAYARAAQAQAHAAAQQRRSEPELEDDGLPPQVPPLAGRRQEPDDPREPFSRNYGRTVAPPPQQQPQRAAALVPADVPVGQRRVAANTAY